MFKDMVGITLFRPFPIKTLHNIEGKMLNQIGNSVPTLEQVRDLQTVTCLLP